MGRIRGGGWRRGRGGGGGRGDGEEEEEEDEKEEVVGRSPHMILLHS